MRIAQGDTVVVIAGKDKGKKGTVLRVLHEQNRVLVGGINLVTKHIRKTAQAPGRTVRLEHSLAASNVMVVDPKTGKPTRIRFAIDPKTKRKVRVAVASGATLERARLSKEDAKKATEETSVQKEGARARKASTAAPFWKKGAAPADAGAAKADAGPAQSTVTHARSAGRGS